MNIENEVLQVNIDDIIPNRFQPRLAFDEQGLKELSDSIKEHGIIQPLVLRKLGDKYEIIAGERRYKASTMAGLVKVPAIISNIDDNKSAEVALVENVQRRDLSAIEEARSYKNLLDKGYLTQEQLAKKMGLSQSTVANKLRLLNLDEEVQLALMDNKISERHARALLKLEDKETQKLWVRKVINERIPVRQLEQELKKEFNLDSMTFANIPNIDEIKSSAKDIKPMNNKRSVESMLLPEDIMNDYSSLPSDVTSQMIQENNNQTPITEAENKFINFDLSEVADMNTGTNVTSNTNSFQFEPVVSPEIVENPIDLISKPEIETLDFDLAPATKSTAEAITAIQNAVKTLNNEGYRINIKETDLSSQYLINIIIEK